MAEAERVIEALLPLLQDQNSSVRFSVIQSLEQIGKVKAVKVMKALIPVLDEASDQSYDPKQGTQQFTTNPLQIQGSNEVAAAATVAYAKLLLSSLESANPVFPVLLDQLMTDQSKLNARYRYAIVKALATWLDTGTPQKSQPSSDNAFHAPADTSFFQHQATQEYEALKQQLYTLCYQEPQLWLRSAGCQVLVEATRLNQQRFSRLSRWR